MRIERLEHTLQVYIPKSQAKVPAVNYAWTELTTQAGGVTGRVTIGGWYNGSVMEMEPINISTWHHKGDLRVLPIVQALFDAGEAAVMVVDDGTAYLYHNQEPED